MSMDSSNFPFVWMKLAHTPGHDFRRDFDAFDLNLKRQEPFVLLTYTVPAEDHEHSQEEKKFTALWMKKRKDVLRKHVLAMVLIEPNAIKRLSFKAFGVMFAAFWGYPLILVESHREAMETAEKLLSQHSKSAAA